MRIIQFALTVQFACVLAVPSLLAASDAPRAMWMAEWLRPNVTERTIGVLTLQDGKLSFDERMGQVDWNVDLAAVKRVAIVNGPSTSLRAGKALQITLTSGEEYVIVVMDPSLTTVSPKKLAAALERAMQALAAGR